MKTKILILVLVIFFLFTACPPEPEITKSWTVAGTVKFVVGSTGNNNIKLAAYYTGSTSSLSSSSKKVSNVVSLGHSTTDAAAFSLNIDASTLTPSNANYIKLVIWEDDNSDDVCDVGTESGYSLYPNKSTGCPCFGAYSSLNSACYYYAESANSLMKTQKGWNQSKGTTEFSPIDSAKKTGATLEYDNSIVDL